LLREIQTEKIRTLLRELQAFLFPSGPVFLAAGALAGYGWLNFPLVFAVGVVVSLTARSWASSAASRVVCV